MPEYGFVWLGAWLIFALDIQIFGSICDGLIDRPRPVGWMAWHWRNWMRREVVIYLTGAWVFYEVFSHLLRGWPGIAATAAALLLIAVIFRGIHIKAYSYAFRNRHKFVGEYEKPKWWPL